MLEGVPDSVDKREGSVIYTTLAPVALALAEQDYMLSYLQNLLFADTSEGSWLDRIVYDFGMEREAATKAIRRIKTYGAEGTALSVPLSSRFAVNGLVFTAKEEIAPGEYRAECGTAGIEGNQYGGEILPVDNINGMARAEMDPVPIIAARDTETDKALRERFYTAMRQSAFGGNIADYEQKTLEVDGVGAVQVFGAPAVGPGNVGIVIGDEQQNKASEELVARVQLLMGTNGNGLAPIGHTVTVKTCTDIAVSVSAQIRLKSGASFDIVKPFAEAAIEAYLENMDFKTGTVFYAKLVADILNSHESIVDVGDVTMNGGTGNITLEKTYAVYQVPTVGTIAVSEVAP